LRVKFEVQISGFGATFGSVGLADHLFLTPKSFLETLRLEKMKGLAFSSGVP
jgi:hypothetical protein